MELKILCEPEAKRAGSRGRVNEPAATASVPALPDIGAFLNPACSRAAGDTLKSFRNLLSHLLFLFFFFLPSSQQLTEYSQSWLVRVVELKPELLSAALPEQDRGSALGF